MLGDDSKSTHIFLPYNYNSLRLKGLLLEIQHWFTVSRKTTKVEKRLWVDIMHVYHWSIYNVEKWPMNRQVCEAQSEASAQWVTLLNCRVPHWYSFIQEPVFRQYVSLHDFTTLPLPQSVLSLCLSKLLMFEAGKMLWAFRVSKPLSMGSFLMERIFQWTPNEVLMAYTE